MWKQIIWTILLLITFVITEFVIRKALSYSNLSDQRTYRIWLFLWLIIVMSMAQFLSKKWYRTILDNGKKEKDSFGTIIFRIFFGFIFFGGDIISEFNLDSSDIPLVYAWVLIAIIMFAVMVYQARKFLPKAQVISQQLSQAWSDGAISNQEMQSIYNNLKSNTNNPIQPDISSQNIGSNIYTKSQHQTVTGVVVNPTSLSGH